MTYTCDICGKEFTHQQVNQYAERDDLHHLCKTCRFTIDGDIYTVADKREIDSIKQLIKIENLIK